MPPPHFLFCQVVSIEVYGLWARNTFVFHGTNCLTEISSVILPTFCFGFWLLFRFLTEMELRYRSERFRLWRNKDDYAHS